MGRPTKNSLAAGIKQSSEKKKRRRNKKAEITPLTEDPEGLKELKKGYDVVTEDRLNDLGELFNKSNVNAGLFGDDHESESSDKVDDEEEGKDLTGLTDDSESSKEDSDDDMDEKPEEEEKNEEEKEEEIEKPVITPVEKTIKENLKTDPVPPAKENRVSHLEPLLTSAEAAALDMFRKNVRDLSDREMTIFLHGYRVRGEHNVKSMEALLHSMNQCATAIASQTRNIKHTANTLGDEVRDVKQNISKKRAAEEKGKGVKIETDEPEDKDFIKKTVTSILTIAGTTAEKVFTAYDLPLSQIYAALEPIVQAIANKDYSFMDAKDWPGSLNDLFFSKKQELAGGIGDSKRGGKKGKKK